VCQPQAVVGSPIAPSVATLIDAIECLDQPGAQQLVGWHRWPSLLGQAGETLSFERGRWTLILRLCIMSWLANLQGRHTHQYVPLFATPASTLRGKPHSHNHQSVLIMMLSKRPLLALLLPPEPRPGVLYYAIALARTLIEDCQVRVTVGMPEPAFDDWEDIAAHFRSLGAAVGVRTLTWIELPYDTAVRMFGSRLDAPSDVSSVMVPHDRARSFSECDGWILFGDTTLGATAWLRPAIVVAPQLAERYTAAFAGQQDVERRIDTFLSWRRARAVLGRTVADRNDLVSFAGVHPDRVAPLPPLSDLPLPDGDTHTAVDNPAIIWHPLFPWPAPATTAATAWREYLEAGGTLPLLIIGRHADAVASAPSVSSVLDECSRIGGRWHTRKVLPGRRLDRLLNRARILWNPSVADDGHWLIARALARGIPAVVADAPHLLNDWVIVDTIPMLRTYAAHDIVAAGAALLAASTDRPVAGSTSPRLSPISVPTISWRETLDTLQLHAHEC
jgi:hypothetical protein